MVKIRTLDGVDVRGKRVLLRADLNVPVQNGQVTDTTRIDRLAPTIHELTAKGARIILMSHFGRPKGCDPKESLKPLVPIIAKELGVKVSFAEDCIGPEAEKAAANLKSGEVLLLENLRFHAGEEANDLEFAKALAKLGDLYVDDAFSAAHRAHASIAAITKLLPSYAGHGMKIELEALDKALGNPARPVMAIVGGAKVSTKLALLHNLVGKVDILVLGGGMANTFLAARGVAVGSSLCERNMADQARAIEREAKAHNCEILLPIDAVVAKKLAPGQETVTVSIEHVPPDRMILDVGPLSIAAIRARLENCRTVVWNGPLGAFEISPFNRGTIAIACEVGEMTQKGKLVSIGGGGDTVAALNAAGVQDAFTYVSTAGGAFLKWMEGKELPGVTPLLFE